MEKKKMDDFTKFKLVYCGEILLFAAVFAVLGVLFLTGILKISEWKIWVFPILTLCGGIYLIVDFIWLLSSKKRQAKNSLIDKLLPFPVAVGLIGFDIYAIISNCILTGDARDQYLFIFRIVLGCVLCYYASVYLFEGIFHWFIPSKALTYAYEEAEKQARLEEQKEAERLAKEQEQKTEETNEKTDA